MAAPGLLADSFRSNSQVKCNTVVETPQHAFGKTMVSPGSPPCLSSAEHLPTLAWDGFSPCRGGQ